MSNEQDLTTEAAKGLHIPVDVKNTPLPISGEVEVTKVKVEVTNFPAITKIEGDIEVTKLPSISGKVELSTPTFFVKDKTYTVNYANGTLPMDFQLIEILPSGWLHVKLINAGSGERYLNTNLIAMVNA